MNVYRIEYNGKTQYVAASSKKVALNKLFGYKPDGASIVKVGEE